MTEIATTDCFGSGGHLFSLKTLLYFCLFCHALAQFLKNLLTESGNGGGLGMLM